MVTPDRALPRQDKRLWGWLSKRQQEDRIRIAYAKAVMARRGRENGRTTPCSNYTARSWSPGLEQPEDARCVNCGETHGPAVGGSESRVAPGQLADEERSAPPTDLGLDDGSYPQPPGEESSGYQSPSS